MLSKAFDHKPFFIDYKVLDGLYRGKSLMIRDFCDGKFRIQDGSWLNAAGDHDIFGKSATFRSLEEAEAFCLKLIKPRIRTNEELAEAGWDV
jgi:hypothetical protein